MSLGCSLVSCRAQSPRQDRSTVRSAAEPLPPGCDVIGPSLRLGAVELYVIDDVIQERLELAPDV
jgi:hypothetical protein